MKCTSCGYESPVEFATCPQCGAAMPTVEPTAQPTYAPPTEPMYAQPVAAHPVYAFLLNFVQDKLFMIIAILTTAATAVQLIAGNGINLIALLVTIFMWLAYSKAQKGELDRNNLRHVSGTVYAMYIIFNVAAIMLIVSGALVALTMGLAAGSIPTDLVMDIDEVPAMVLEWFLGAGGIVVGAIIALMGGGMLLISIFCYKRLHRFAKSLYESIDTLQFAFVHQQSAYGWLLAIGIIDAISAAGVMADDLLSGVAAGCTAAAYIVSAVLVKKHFLDPQPQQPQQPM